MANASQKYTAVHWLGSEILVEPFEAPNYRIAYAQFQEMGWNAYDDRKLLKGHFTELEVRRLETAY